MLGFLSPPDEREKESGLMEMVWAVLVMLELLVRWPLSTLLISLVILLAVIDNLLPDSSRSHIRSSNHCTNCKFSNAEQGDWHEEPILRLGE